MSRAALVKPVLFALLGVNAAVYALNDRGTETLDAVAWFALLLLFEAETRWPCRTRMPGRGPVLLALRLAAATAIAWAAVTFVRESAWLDAVNAWLWIGVVIVLELEVRAPSTMARYRGAAVTLSMILYLGLVAVAVAWLVQREWFDGYDALLWVAAFALLERDLLGRLPGRSRHDPEARPDGLR